MLVCRNGEAVRRLVEQMGTTREVSCRYIDGAFRELINDISPSVNCLEIVIDGEEPYTVAFVIAGDNRYELHSGSSSPPLKIRCQARLDERIHNFKLEFDIHDPELKGVITDHCVGGEADHHVPENPVRYRPRAAA